jgi:hypothetical protein
MMDARVFAQRASSSSPATILIGASSMHKGANGWQGGRAVACDVTREDDIIRLIDETIPGSRFSLDQVLPDGMRTVVARTVSDLSTRFGEQYARLYRDLHDGA